MPDYALWQRKYLQGELFDKKLNYWRTKLEGIAALQLPTDYQGIQFKARREPLHKLK
jgi:hypothetical protein